MSIWLFLIISNLHHYTDFISKQVEGRENGWERPTKEEEISELVGKIKLKQVEGKEKWLGKTYERGRNRRISRQIEARAKSRKR